MSTLLALLTFMINYGWLGDHSNNPEGKLPEPKQLLAEYDFVIIGAGSSGAVIANRLSEIGAWTVLLLEAGGEESRFNGQAPILAADYQLTERDWQFRTVTMPNQACMGMVDEVCLWPRGKMVGGSSSLNYMLYVRGNRRDYDLWANLGNYGWSYKDVLPYFIKSEDNKNPYLAKSKYHGTGGYLSVSEAPYRSPLAEAFIRSGIEMGYENVDGNGEKQTGFMFPQGTVERGRRCSTAKAFLRPIRFKRKNLHISMNSRAHKILIDSKSKTAYGVRFEKKGTLYEIRAKKEVVLSAGDTGSPHILMLSGIGPKVHLERVGLSPIAELPVGENMHDHVALGEIVFLIDKPYTLTFKRLNTLQNILNYTAWGTTGISTFGAVEGLAWIKTKYANQSDDWPDLQYHFVSSCVSADDGRKVRFTHGVSERVWDEYYKPILGQDCWSLLPVTLRPRSRGYIRLKSANPYEKPIINPNYYADPYDVKVMVEGIKFALKLSQTKAFQELGTQFYAKPFPGCESHPMGSDAYFECWIRSYPVTLAHTAGTCKMGPNSDPEAVVDPELRVRGIANLRVADTSIMPLVPSGNTNAAAVMIGERASDLIKNKWLRV